MVMWLQLKRIYEDFKVSPQVSGSHSCNSMALLSSINIATLQHKTNNCPHTLIKGVQASFLNSTLIKFSHDNVLNKTNPFSRLSDTEVCPRTTRQIDKHPTLLLYQALSSSQMYTCFFLQFCHVCLASIALLTSQLASIALLTSQLITIHFVICLRLG